MTLIKFRIGFLFCTVVTFWNTSSGYLIQSFNSQTLRGDLQKCLIILSHNNLTQKIWPELFKIELGKDCSKTFIEIPKILEL